jgi:YaaC-like Protein
MVLNDEAMTWFRLHERRSSLHERSKLDDTNGRRQTFAAAMTQFEEQFTAAKAVTAATRPLNLYYGLAQAGMAIAAAHAPDPWSFSRHGLRLGDRNPELADMLVGPEGQGGFQKVATATGSPLITAPVSLGTLWASLPDLAEVGTLPGSAWRIPLELSDDTFPARRPRATLYLPGEMPEEPDSWMAAFKAMMADYPSAAGWAIPIEDGGIQITHRPDRQWEITLRWPAKEACGEMSEEELEAFFGKVAPEYRYRGDRFLRPSVDGAGGPPPSPLMTWWLLLYSFSILSRYEPRRWVKLLDRDSSKVAVLLRYALEEALTAVPQLVLEALDTKPTLLAKPLAF